jgi:periplasmic mercuric ion binding protein
MKRLMALLLLVSSLAHAGDVTVHVQGMVCSFCAQGLSKKFQSEKAVETFKVSLDEKVVQLKFKQGQNLTDEYLKEVITESGLNVEKIVRSGS